ncbi:MAG TPA: methenyltetrahydromethanopterin cyclohydrolase [Gemmatimonadaceae bacterium]|nr:methenyltetrahydromethanopterin cyclohydrolase [Gemmatimonadaceae bacterium]
MDRASTARGVTSGVDAGVATPGPGGGLGLNERAWRLADALAARHAELRVAVHALATGARVIDAGIAAPGGVGAGLALAELCMGGLGHVAVVPVPLGGGLTLPGLQVWTDHPAESCMASQYAGWAVQVGDFFAMGSGPLRAHARVERELFEKLGYAERADRGVLVLEGRTLPTPEVAAWLGEKAGLDPSRLTLAVAPTASTAGGVQVVARVLETGLHKMEVLGFDVTRVRSGTGTAPLPPVAKNDLRAIGRTNDCILYGARAHYLVDAPDEELEPLAARMPSEASADYGTPFYETFKRYGGDFYKIDRLLFSPAEVWLTSATSGRTFRGGSVNVEVLRGSLFE